MYHAECSRQLQRDPPTMGAPNPLSCRVFWRGHTLGLIPSQQFGYVISSSLPTCMVPPLYFQGTLCRLRGFLSSWGHNYCVLRGFGSSSCQNDCLLQGFGSLWSHKHIGLCGAKTTLFRRNCGLHGTKSTVFSRDLCLMVPNDCIFLKKCLVLMGPELLCSPRILVLMEPKLLCVSRKWSSRCQMFSKAFVPHATKVSCVSSDCGTRAIEATVVSNDFGP